MYEVLLSPEAEEFYRSADRPLARKLARCFAQLEREPRRNNNIKRLTGPWSGCYRYRVGDWRVLYRIVDESHRVQILIIAHRREVYD